MTPCQVGKNVFPPLGKMGNFFWVFRTPSGLVLSENSIVISVVQVPCSFYWTKYSLNTDKSEPYLSVFGSFSCHVTISTMSQSLEHYTVLYKASLCFYKGTCSCTLSYNRSVLILIAPSMLRQESSIWVCNQYLTLSTPKM